MRTIANHNAIREMYLVCPWIAPECMIIIIIVSYGLLLPYYVPLKTLYEKSIDTKR